jgi:hypothetical protein
MFPKVDVEQELNRSVARLEDELTLRPRVEVSPPEPGWWEFTAPPLTPAKSGGQASDPIIDLPLLRNQFAKAPTPEAKAAAALDLGQAWGTLNPQEAITWLSALAEAAEQTAAAAGIARSWSASEPIACGEWVASLPEGQVRDTAAAELAKGSGKFLPKLALSFALNLPTAAARISAADVALQSAATDAESKSVAKEQISESTLSNREKAELMERLESYHSGVPSNP